MTGDFDRIYRENAWSGVQSRSGPGSSLAATSFVREWLVGLIAELGITSLLDVPCGDGVWIPPLGVPYIGVDVVPEAVEAAQSLVEGQFFVGDARNMELPNADAVLTRDGMQHLDVADGMLMLANLKRTGARWLIASHYLDGSNVDPPTSWDAYRVNLTLGPFWLAEPDRMCPDGFGEDGALQDPGKVLGVWRL
jgi:hypothetical protein